MAFGFGHSAQLSFEFNSMNMLTLVGAFIRVTIKLSTLKLKIEFGWIWVETTPELIAITNKIQNDTKWAYWMYNSTVVEFKLELPQVYMDDKKHQKCNRKWFRSLVKTLYPFRTLPQTTTTTKYLARHIAIQ